MATDAKVVPLNKLTEDAIATDRAMLLTTDGTGSAADAAEVREAIGISQAESVKRFGAVGDCVEREDFTITATESTLVSASSTFSSADVGKTIFIAGAGSGGADLLTTIVAYNGVPSQVQIQTAASTTVNGARGAYGTDDQAALQDAIDWAIENSSEITLAPNKNYLLASFESSNRHLVCDVDYDYDNRFTFSGGVNSKLINCAASGFTVIHFTKRWNRPILRNIHFRNIQTPSSATKIGIGSTAGGTVIDDMTVEGCTFEGFSRSIVLNGHNRPTIRRNHFLAPWGHDGGTDDSAPNVHIWSFSNANGLVRDLRVLDNYFTGYSGINGLATDAPVTTQTMDGGIYGTPDGCLIANNIFRNFEFEAVTVGSWTETSTTFTDGAITASDNTLTSTGSFASRSAGDTVWVEGAAAAGADLWTTIASVTSDDEVELTDAAGTTVSGANGGTGETREWRPNLIEGNTIFGLMPSGGSEPITQYAMRIDVSNAKITNNHIVDCKTGVFARTNEYRHQGVSITGNTVLLTNYLNGGDPTSCFYMETETGGVVTRYSDGCVIADNTVIINNETELAADLDIVKVARVRDCMIENNRIIVRSFNTNATYKLTGIAVRTSSEDVVIRGNTQRGGDNFFNFTGLAGEVLMFDNHADRLVGNYFKTTPTTDILPRGDTVITRAIGSIGADLTTGTTKDVFRMPFAVVVEKIVASVNVAPVDATLTVDVNEGGSTILSTKLTIDSGEKTSTTAATPAVLSDRLLAADSEITIDIDQVGSTTAGQYLTVQIIGSRID